MPRVIQAELNNAYVKYVVYLSLNHTYTSLAWPLVTPYPSKHCNLIIGLAQELHRTQKNMFAIASTIDAIIWPHKYSFSNLQVLDKLTKFGNLIERLSFNTKGAHAKQDLN